MARKRKGSNAALGALFPLIIFVALLAQIPKPVWIILAIGVAVGLICWLVFKPGKHELASPKARESASLATIADDEPLELHTSQGQERGN